MIPIIALIFLSLFSETTPVIYKCNREASCGCSKTSSFALSRIIGGEPVSTPLSWRWMASLRRNGSHICGASVVSDSYVITAAHCFQLFEPLSLFTLHFGTAELSGPGPTRTIAQLNIHPLYDPTAFLNDLAVIRLSAPLNLTDRAISRICLPPKGVFDNQSTEYPPVGQSLVAIGWGVTDPNSESDISPTLQQVTVQTLARTDPNCTSSIYDGIVQFCAGGADGLKDTCRGDSGGPLMMFDKGQWQLVGITSSGPFCAVAGYAGVYTRIAYYHNYIEQIIHPNRTNLSTTTIGNIRQSSTMLKQYPNAGNCNRIFIFLIYFAFISIL